jgi:large subunit ribosomal protein L9
MDVILLQDVEKVGLKGDVVNVARGYARNFLLPRRLAEPATAGRLAELQRHHELRARHEAQSVEQAQETAKTLEGVELRFERKAGPTGSLFGSVTATDVAEELWNGKRIRVDRKKIDLQDPIKRVGRYDVPIELFTDVSVDMRVLVVPEGGELPPEEELEPEPEPIAAPEAAESAVEPEPVPAAAEAPAVDAAAAETDDRAAPTAATAEPDTAAPIPATAEPE